MAVNLAHKGRGTFLASKQSSGRKPYAWDLSAAYLPRLPSCHVNGQSGDKVGIG
jgi:hypothetical protein